MHLAVIVMCSQEILVGMKWTFWCNFCFFFFSDKDQNLLSKWKDKKQWIRCRRVIYAWFFFCLFLCCHIKKKISTNCFSSTLSKVCIDHSYVIYMTSDCGAIHVCPYHHSCISWRPHYPLNKPRLLLFSDGAIVCFFIWLCWGLWIWGCCGFGFSLSCFSWLLLRLVQCCPRCCFDVALRCLMVSLYFPLSYVFFCLFLPFPLSLSCRPVPVFLWVCVWCLS